MNGIGTGSSSSAAAAASRYRPAPASASATAGETAGASRQRVNAELRTLEREGLIELGHRKLRVHGVPTPKPRAAAAGPSAHGGQHPRQ